MIDTRVRLALLGVSVAGFVMIAALVQASSTLPVDAAALDLLRPFHGGPLDPLMIAVSDLGNSNVLGYLTILVAAFLWSQGSGRAAAFVAVGFLLSALASDALKAALARPRPAAIYQVQMLPPQTDHAIWTAIAIVIAVALWRTRWRWEAVAGAAFLGLSIWFVPADISTSGTDSLPSGHALRSTVLAVSVLYVLPWRPTRGTVIALAAILLAIGISRVYLGQHHPTDVVAGWLAGLALVCALSLLPPFSSAAVKPGVTQHNQPL